MTTSTAPEEQEDKMTTLVRDSVELRREVAALRKQADQLEERARQVDQENSGPLACRHALAWERDDANYSNHMSVRVTFVMTCGCELDTLSAFARWAKQELGWEVRTTSGWGAVTHGDVTRYGCYVSRRSLGAT